MFSMLGRCPRQSACLGLDVQFWEESSVPGSPQWASEELGGESVPPAQLLLPQFPASLLVELRASSPARVHSVQKHRTSHRDYGIDTSGQGLLEVYGGHSEASVRQQKEKGESAG